MNLQVEWLVKNTENSVKYPIKENAKVDHEARNTLKTTENSVEKNLKHKGVPNIL